MDIKSIVDEIYEEKFKCETEKNKITSNDNTKSTNIDIAVDGVILYKLNDVIRFCDSLLSLILNDDRDMKYIVDKIYEEMYDTKKRIDEIEEIDDADLSEEQIAINDAILTNFENRIKFFDSLIKSILYDWY